MGNILLLSFPTFSKFLRLLGNLHLAVNKAGLQLSLPSAKSFLIKKSQTFYAYH